MSNYHILKDYETLSEKSWECPIVNLSIVVFDMDRFTSDNLYTFEELVEELVEEVDFYKFDVEDQVKNHNRVISKDTLDWWNSLDKKVRKQIEPSDDDIKVDELIKIFECLNV